MIGRKFCWGWRKRTNANSAFKKSSQARVREDSQANKARKVFCGWQVHHHFWMRSQARIRGKRRAFEIWAMCRVWEGLMTRLDGSSRFANRRRSRISFGVKVCTVARRRSTFCMERNQNYWVVWQVAIDWWGPTTPLRFRSPFRTEDRDGLP